MNRSLQGLRLMALFGLLASAQATAAPWSGAVQHDLRGAGNVRIAVDAVKVEQAWARASAGNATTGAAYVTLLGGTQADRLVGASTPAATTAEVHESFADNGVMKMRPVPGLAVPAGETVTLAPGGYHVMLTGLKQKLVAGGSFPLTLRFEHASPITVDVQVRPLGQAAPVENPPIAHDHQHQN